MLGSDLFAAPANCFSFSTTYVGGTTVNTSRGRAALMAENVDRVAMGLEPLHQIEPGVNL